MNGLAIHMGRKHRNIKQLDGNVTDDEENDTEDNKYHGTRHYWKSGRLSTVYQSFLDGQEIIQKSDLNDHEKQKEKPSCWKQGRLPSGTISSTILLGVSYLVCVVFSTPFIFWVVVYLTFYTLHTEPTVFEI